MKNKFHRTGNADLSSWNRILSEMRDDLTALSREDVTEGEARIYLNELLTEARPSKRAAGARFFGFDEPENMSADARVDYCYAPTYLAAAIAMRILDRFPEIEAGDRIAGKDSMTVEDALRVLSEAMLGCTLRNFSGDGFDGLSGRLDALEIIVRADALRFIMGHPALCPQFNRCFLCALGECAAAFDRGSLAGDWGEDYAGRFAPILDMEGADLSRFDSAALAGAFGAGAGFVFVYGTLMLGQAAAEKMAGAMFLGDAVLDGYAMYDLGWYPGVVPSPGNRVFGQVYLAEAALMGKLDEYENEGELYHRRGESVIVQGMTLPVQVYVYGKEAAGLRVDSGCWDLKETDDVWYCAYGSNLCADRFRSYIQGVEGPSGREAGCRDRTLWRDDAVMSAPGKIYFAGNSFKWNGGGVAYFDPDGDGTAWMRRYKITFGQLLDVFSQEGGSYDDLLLLGSFHGIPAFTITSKRRYPGNRPGNKYLSLICTALCDECGLPEAEAQAYLADCVGVDG